MTTYTKVTNKNRYYYFPSFCGFVKKNFVKQINKKWFAKIQKQNNWYLETL
jgi:hypothetical protein